MTLDSQVAEWLNIATRWVHVIAGIMWVGNSMLFNWLDRNLLSGGQRGKFGETWLLHSGGFYRVEKFMLNSSEMPPVLHWFKWQSYTTWITGFLLLLVVYYADGGGFLVPAVEGALSPTKAALLGLGLIFGGFVVYDVFWRVLGPRAPALAGALSIAGLFALTWWLCQVFTGRAAYIHIGALLGTFMAGNVFCHIIPSQKEMVAAIQAGKGFSEKLADRAKQRSIHNNYFTFPLIFTMISNHFGGIYGHDLAWLILILLMVGSALARHFLNIRFTFKAWRPCFAATLVAMTGSIAWIVKTPEAEATPATVEGETPVSFAEARHVIHQRCLACHSIAPTDKVLSLATGGVHFDTPDEIRKYGERIHFRAVETKTMPFNNTTGITDEERALLGKWIKQGMNIP